MINSLFFGLFRHQKLMIIKASMTKNNIIENNNNIQISMMMIIFKVLQNQ